MLLRNLSYFVTYYHPGPHMTVAPPTHIRPACVFYFFSNCISAILHHIDVFALPHALAPYAHSPHLIRLLPSLLPLPPSCPLSQTHHAPCPLSLLSPTHMRPLSADPDLACGWTLACITMASPSHSNFVVFSFGPYTGDMHALCFLICFPTTDTH